MLERTIVLPPHNQRSTVWGTIPEIQPRALDYAKRGLPEIRRHCDISGAGAMTFIVEGIGTGRRRYSSILWKEDGTDVRIERQVPDMEAVQRLEAIGGCLMELIRDMHSRWPKRAKPKAIGFLSDGCRLIFSPSHPAAEGDWLLSHLNGSAPAVEIIGDQHQSLLSSILPRK